ncbi:MAG: NADH-quinone oxidoreductase subunit NuoB [Coriobacteriales bacterium]|jgi:ech hydrogenase subunit C|nr:NADH-quinone oxidoreductase subunit NuoB [Coriobacteriales bacterium]
MSSTIKSPWLIHYDASSCNGCDIEVLACLTPLYDVERFGIINTGNPKHADIFLVTGSVNERNVNVLQQIYDQMLEPKVVIACGICACSGGVFRDCYNTLGGIDVAIPVDVYAPGCAIRPEAIIDAVVAGLGVLEEKRAAFAAGTLETPELPDCVTAADKLVEGELLRDNYVAKTQDMSAAAAVAATTGTIDAADVAQASAAAAKARAAAANAAVLNGGAGTAASAAAGADAAADTDTAPANTATTDAEEA